MRFIKIIAICTSLFFLLNAEAQKQNNKILLRINGEKTSVDDFLKSYYKNKTPEPDLKSTSIHNYLDLYINYRLKVIEAKALRMDTISELRHELNGYLKKLAAPYLINDQIHEALLHEAYERSKFDIRASHILVGCKKDASPEDTLKAYQRIIELRNRALNGEDFNVLAAKYSDDLSARDQTNNQGQVINKGNAGDLGYFTVFNMVYPFENAAYQTPVNEISNPIRTRFGYHLLKPTDKHEALGQAKVAHIFLADDKSEGNVKDQKDKIFLIHRILKRDNNFEKLVERYSEDKTTVLANGVLPPFGANEMVPEFYLSVFTVDSVNGFSEPVKTPYGWHIIKLLERKKPGSFIDEKNGLITKIKNDKRSEAAYLSYLEIIKKSAVFEEFEEAKDELFSSLNPDLLKGTWYPEKDLRPDNILFKLGKQNFTQSDFVAFILKNQQHQSTSTLLTYFENLYVNFVNDVSENYFFQNIEEFQPELKSLIDEYWDGILLFELSNKLIWQPSMDDENILKAYYQEHRANYENFAFEEIKGKIISDYQDQLEQDWIKKLRIKYPVKINQKALSKIINE